MKEILQRAIPFKVYSKVPKNPAGKRRGKGASAKAGLAIGRHIDHMFQRVVAKKERVTTQPKHRRIRLIMKALKEMGVTPIKTQLAVAVPEFGLKTSLDGIGLTADGHPVVLELKCSQYELAQHDDKYAKPCVQNAMLANGVSNTEKNLHLLQCGFGMLAVKKMFPVGTPIFGKVIYCAKDGVRTYNCDQRWTAPKLFALGANRLKKKLTTKTPLDSYAKLSKLPELDVNRQPFLEFAAKHKCVGFSDTLLGYGSYVGGKGIASKPFVVVGILHSPTASPTTKRYQGAVARVVADAGRLQKTKAASHCKVKAALIVYGGGNFIWKTCRVPRANK